MKTETLSIKSWADTKFKEHRDTIEFYISEGIEPAKAFHLVMDNSTLGAGYKAQMRRDLNLSIFV